MMRKRGLRRWVLRGALFSMAVAPFVVSDTAQAEWNWQDAPPQKTVVNTVDPGTNQPNFSDRLEEWNWQ